MGHIGLRFNKTTKNRSKHKFKYGIYISIIFIKRTCLFISLRGYKKCKEKLELNIYQN